MSLSSIFTPRIRFVDKLLFTKHLSVMLRTGIPVVQKLRIQEKGPERPFISVSGFVYRCRCGVFCVSLCPPPVGRFICFTGYGSAGLHPFFAFFCRHNEKLRCTDHPFFFRPGIPVGGFYPPAGNPAGLAPVPAVPTAFRYFFY